MKLRFDSGVYGKATCFVLYRGALTSRASGGSGRIYGGSIAYDLYGVEWALYCLMYNMR